jgi:hypothetical protein
VGIGTSLHLPFGKCLFNCLAPATAAGFTRHTLQGRDVEIHVVFSECRACKAAIIDMNTGAMVIIIIIISSSSSSSKHSLAVRHQQLHHVVYGQHSPPVNLRMLVQRQPKDSEIL